LNPTLERSFDGFLRPTNCTAGMLIMGNAFKLGGIEFSATQTCIATGVSFDVMR
jgi:hypothetical protein